MQNQVNDFDKPRTCILDSEQRLHVNLYYDMHVNY